jgi:ABC-type multidrug transport system ATPase subunit
MQLFIRDLDSDSGTFINEQEIRGQVELRAGDVLRIGSAEFVMPGPDRHGRQVPEGGSAGVSLQVIDAAKVVQIKGAGKRSILENVSFQVRPGEFVGILGGSGSGKSTLMKAIAGLIPLTGGEILMNGVSPAVRATGDLAVAYLPQDVVIHEALSPAVALDYIAQLKQLGDTAVERDPLIREALTHVGLGERATVPIQSLSGGQRKRVALAAELLGNPQLILLDEATSGLDPATEADMMSLFRSLADEGRTVLCITHFPGQLHLCDRLLYLMHGLCIFDGTPEELKSFFGIATIEEAYSKQSEKAPAEWAAFFRENALKPGTAPAPRYREFADAEATDVPSFETVIRQARILTSRYIRLQLADVRNLLLLFAQPPVIAFMIAATFGSIKVSFAELHAADTKQVAFLLVLAVLWCSGTISVREIVKETAIFRHELRFGVGILPYLASKFVLLGAFALTQTVMLLLMVRSFTDLTGPGFGQIMVLGTTALAGVGIGLLVSAVAGSSERAMTLLPVLLIAQAIFSGGLARMTGVGRSFSMVFIPAYWSLDGLKAQFSSDLANATFPGAPGHYQPPILGQGGPLMVDLLVLGLQCVALLGAVYFALSWSIDTKSSTAFAAKAMSTLRRSVLG